MEKPKNEEHPSQLEKIVGCLVNAFIFFATKRKLKAVPERKREDMLLIIPNAALVLGQQMISCWGCGLATKLPP